MNEKKNKRDEGKPSVERGVKERKNIDLLFAGRVYETVGRWKDR
jgi:hypothetical protein